MCSCKSVRSVELEDAISLTPSSCRGRGFQKSSCPVGPRSWGRRRPRPARPEAPCRVDQALEKRAIALDVHTVETMQLPPDAWDV